MCAKKGLASTISVCSHVHISYATLFFCTFTCQEIILSAQYRHEINWEWFISTSFHFSGSKILFQPYMIHPIEGYVSLASKFCVHYKGPSWKVSRIALFTANKMIWRNIDRHWLPYMIACFCSLKLWPGFDSLAAFIRMQWICHRLFLLFFFILSLFSLQGCIQSAGSLLHSLVSIIDYLPSIIVVLDCSLRIRLAQVSPSILQLSWSYLSLPFSHFISFMFLCY